jgi:hypothetical protein
VLEFAQGPFQRSHIERFRGTFDIRPDDSDLRKTISRPDSFAVMSDVLNLREILARQSTFHVPQIAQPSFDECRTERTNPVRWRLCRERRPFGVPGNRGDQFFPVHWFG